MRGCVSWLVGRKAGEGRTRGKWRVEGNRDGGGGLLGRLGHDALQRLHLPLRLHIVVLARHVLLPKAPILQVRGVVEQRRLLVLPRTNLSAIDRAPRHSSMAEISGWAGSPHRRRRAAARPSGTRCRPPSYSCMRERSSGSWAVAEGPLLCRRGHRRAAVARFRQGVSPCAQSIRFR